MTRIIHNATIVNEGKRFNGYVAINNEFISEVGEGSVPESLLADAELIDAQGAYLLPGAIDTHTHFREPGLTHKATIGSESAAAVAGGVTSFLEMPNTKPATVTEEAVNAKKAIAAATSYANYGFFIAATNDNIDQIIAADYTTIPGIKLFVGSSTGNMLVNSPEALEKLFAEFPGVIAVHAEDEAIIRANREWLMKEYGENAPVALHSLLRSREACVKASEFVADLARKHNSRLHLLHISTADELRLLSPDSIESKRITAETCPHYLLFTAADLLDERGYTRKCNPAIKGESDRDALRKALADGLIDVVATDHAPHLLSEKQGSLFTAASGMPGVKFMLSLMLSMTDDQSLTIERVVEKVAHNPARLYSIDRRGFIRPGYYADLTLVDPLASPRAITDDSVATLGAPAAGCDWAPYLGQETRYAVRSTWVNGKLVYDAGRIIGSNRNPLPISFNH